MAPAAPPTHAVRRLIAAAAICVLFFPSGADGHATGLSYLSLSASGHQVSASFDLPAVDLAEAFQWKRNPDGSVIEADLPAHAAALAGWLGDKIRLTADGRPCPASGGTAELRDGTLLTLRTTYECPWEPQQLKVETFAAETVGSSYSTFVELRRPVGKVDRTLLTGGTTAHTFAVESTESAFSVALEFVALGVHHIFTGYDHILFLLSLLLLSESLGRIVALASAFTVAHTITLSLAATNMVQLPSRFTESAIAASIAYVAVENWLYARRPAPGKREPLGLRLRWVLTFAFGLVHGFGFASALAERGLPRAHLPLALGSFNAGVELGQLAIVAASYPLLMRAGRLSWYRPSGVRYASAGVFLVAVYWFSQRAFSG